MPEPPPVQLPRYTRLTGKYVKQIAHLPLLVENARRARSRFRHCCRRCCSCVYEERVKNPPNDRRFRHEPRDAYAQYIRVCCVCLFISGAAKKYTMKNEGGRCKRWNAVNINHIGRRYTRLVSFPAARDIGYFIETVTRKRVVDNVFVSRVHAHRCGRTQPMRVHGHRWPIYVGT